uniref:Uncharacterized protein n=1 Tax=Acanthochromis polyacanthus TaxID=80966 RepID=A0A3Q1EEP6_9TELE
MFSVIEQKPRVTTEGLPESLDLVNISFPQSPICKSRWKVVWSMCRCRIPQRKLLYSKNPLTAHLMFLWVSSYSV